MITWTTFVEAVEEHFRFLEDEFRFSLVARKEPFVVFGSAVVRVNVYCDIHRHAELDLGLERVADVGKRTPFFRIEQFRKLQGLPLLPRTAPFVETDEQMTVELQRLAYDLKECCSDVLRGNLNAFEQIECQRKG